MFEALWNIAHVDDPFIPGTESGDDVEKSRRGHGLNYGAVGVIGVQSLGFGCE